MANATTMTYDELLLEVEFTAGSGTYSKICGMTGVTINRTTQVREDMVPDCDDETLPHDIARTVTSISVSVSATGVWASERKHEMLDWFHNARKLSVRLRDTEAEANGATDDIYAETGTMILTSITNERPAEKGLITAQIELQNDGAMTLSQVA